MNTRIAQQLEFLKEIDRLKDVWRRTFLVDGTRRENDAEHSWELAVMALVLYEHAPAGTDLLHSLKLLLVHDLVEIYAGDTFAFDREGHKSKDEREQAAAVKLFVRLPEDQAGQFLSLWQEFEAAATPEAQFALCMDRLQPFLHNLYTRGGTWPEFGIRKEQVLRRNEPWAPFVPSLWTLVQELTEQAVKDGILHE